MTNEWKYYVHNLDSYLAEGIQWNWKFWKEISGPPGLFSKQKRDQGSSPPLLTNLSTPKQDKGEESILSFYSTHRLELILPILTTIPSKHLQSDSAGTQIRSLCCSQWLPIFVSEWACSASQCPNGKAETSHINKGIWVFFPLPLAIFFFSFFKLMLEQSR